MFSGKHRIRYRVAAVPLLIVFLVMVFPGWGNGGGDEDRLLTTATQPTTSTPPSETSPSDTSSEPALDTDNPVKIGLLCDFTGTTATGAIMSAAAKLVEDQVEAQGGILDGRPVKIERADGKGTVSDAVAGFRRLAREQHVSAVVGGGGTAAQTLANTEIAEELGVPYFNWGKAPDDLTDYPYNVRAIILKTRAMAETTADFIINELKSRKVAILVDNTEMHELADELTHLLEVDGTEVVMTEYIPLETKDFSPYLTRVKYEEADLIVSATANPGAYSAMFRQLMDLGGWGDIKFLSLAATSMLSVSMPEAEGTYHLLTWVPGSSYPGNQEFEQDFKAKYGTSPNVAHFYTYMCLWTAIHAIELADSDTPRDVAQAARSGHLWWESPVGSYRISEDGEHNMGGDIFVVRDGKFTAVPSED